MNRAGEDCNMIISIHIPKTAGSTFSHYLRKIYGNDICYDYTDLFKTFDIEPPNMKMRLQRFVRKCYHGRHKLKKSDKCIHGHFLPKKYLSSYPDAFLAVWLRDPVERVVSHYLHWKRNKPTFHSICKKMVEENWTLEEFATYDRMRNLQSFYLQGVSISEFGFIGIQENFDEMIESFFKLVQFPFDYIQPRNVNKSKSYNNKYDIDMGMINVIKKLNSEDQELYERCIELVKERGLI